ncbi:hypothetical protein PROFUN_02329 [Planoprotostelium fungivorum]|uniref:Uncharacterized protein n=1 Tax=Planoprotostelium fungivorum TaxID=1890364 RepID=A0A2P6NYM0_9EUKA|nr:hypothetical protein PROFUN_02329 [Planoprotostelium fungivorum]
MGEENVTIRSLLWPGYAFAVSDSPVYGSVNFDFGKKNDDSGLVSSRKFVIHGVELETEKDNMKENRSDPVQFIQIRRSRNADVLPGLGTAILRTPQPRQTLACLHRRDPRKGCSTPARFDHIRDFIICAVDAITYGLLPEGNTSRASSIGCRSDS